MLKLRTREEKQLFIRIQNLLRDLADMNDPGEHGEQDYVQVHNRKLEEAAKLSEELEKYEVVDG